MATKTITQSTTTTQLAAAPSQASYPTQTNNTNRITTNGNYSGIVTVGPSVITTSTYSTTAANWYNYYDRAKTKFFKLGGRKICIWNYYNKYFMVDNVIFSFETTGTTVRLNITTSCQVRMNTLDELRNYIKTMKVYYLKAKEFEKQLNMSGDFT
jgi:hypothetical protein